MTVYSPFSVSDMRTKCTTETHDGIFGRSHLERRSTVDDILSFDGLFAHSLHVALVHSHAPGLSLQVVGIVLQLQSQLSVMGI